MKHTLKVYEKDYLSVGALYDNLAELCQEGWVVIVYPTVLTDHRAAKFADSIRGALRRRKVSGVSAIDNFNSITIRKK